MLFYQLKRYKITRTIWLFFLVDCIKKVEKIVSVISNLGRVVISAPILLLRVVYNGIIESDKLVAARRGLGGYISLNGTNVLHLFMFYLIILQGQVSLKRAKRLCQFQLYILMHLKALQLYYKIFTMKYNGCSLASL